MTQRRTARGTQNADEPARDTDERDRDRDDTRSATRTASRSGGDGITAAQAAQRGLHQVAELTGKQTEGVTGVEPAEDGWIVGIEVIEDRRIPSSTDLMATYEAELDMDGDLLSYRRMRRYTRGRGDDSEGS